MPDLQTVTDTVPLEPAAVGDEEHNGDVQEQEQPGEEAVGGDS